MIIGCSPEIAGDRFTEMILAVRQSGLPMESNRVYLIEWAILSLKACSKGFFLLNLKVADRFLLLGFLPKSMAL